MQELFLTETTDHADVVFPASSFAEVDGTFTNNAGNVQRVRKAIDPLHQSKPDWMITTLIAREMGIGCRLDFSASRIFKAIADAVPAYAGLRYPQLRDESNPVQVKARDQSKADLSTRDRRCCESVSKRCRTDGTKEYEKPRIGHKLHRLTTMTSKTPQFHLLAHGNPKPENLLVSPLVQFDLDGKPRDEELPRRRRLVLADRSNPKAVNSR